MKIVILYFGYTYYNIYIDIINNNNKYKYNNKYLLYDNLLFKAYFNQFNIQRDYPASR